MINSVIYKSTYNISWYFIASSFCIVALLIIRFETRLHVSWFNSFRKLQILKTKVDVYLNEEMKVHTTCNISARVHCFYLPLKYDLRTYIKNISHWQRSITMTRNFLKKAWCISKFSFHFEILLPKASLYPAITHPIGLIRCKSGTFIKFYQWSWHWNTRTFTKGYYEHLINCKLFVTIFEYIQGKKQVL